MAAVFGFAFCLATTPQDSYAESWPIKTFQVVAIEPSAHTENNRVFFEQFVRNLRELGIDPDNWPLLANTVEPSPELSWVTAEVEETLALAASVFEGQGFRNPALEPRVTRPDGKRAYRVYLRKDKEGVSGNYHPEHCDKAARGDRVILLDYDDIQIDGRLTNDGIQIVAHELFHAVQHGSPFFQGCKGGSVGAWITEGTANTAGWFVAFKLQGQAVLDWMDDALVKEFDRQQRRARVWGRRNYTRSLPIPRPGRASAEVDAYGTSSFWTYLAEYEATGGQPRVPGRNRKSLKYLARLFDTSPVERDCRTPQADCRAEVVWLEAQLKAYFRKTLRELYARFAGAYALYGASRIIEGWEWDRNWLASSFFPDGCIEVKLGPAKDALQIEKTVPVFKPLSMRCWQIKLFGFEEEQLPVAISVKIRSGAQLPTLKQLTSMVAGGERPKKARLESLPGNVQRASWEYDFPVLKSKNSKGPLFLLTNVADIADDTLPYRDIDRSDLTLTFTVLREYASMGSSNLDGATLADAIDTALPIELDNYRALLIPGQHKKLGESFVGKGYSKGVVNPCVLTISGFAKRKPGLHFSDGLNLFLQTSGPIRPITYPIFDPPPGSDYKAKLPPGHAVAGVGLTDAPEGHHDFQFMTGRLKIDAISPALIRGRVTGLGGSKELSTVTGRNEVVATRSLSAKFSIRLKGIMGKYREGAYPCLE